MHTCNPTPDQTTVMMTAIKPSGTASIKFVSQSTNLLSDFLGWFSCPLVSSHSEKLKGSYEFPFGCQVTKKLFCQTHKILRNSEKPQRVNSTRRNTEQLQGKKKQSQTVVQQNWRPPQLRTSEPNRNLVTSWAGHALPVVEQDRQATVTCIENVFCLISGNPECAIEASMKKKQHFTFSENICLIIKSWFRY